MVDVLKIVRARDTATSGEARRIREAAGLSLNELARAVGTSGTVVASWENGTHRPTGLLAAAYVDLLDELAERQAVGA